MNFAEAETSGEQGVALFRAIHALDPDLPVLLMTAWTSLETAVQLVKEGAADYLAKPWDDSKLVRNVQNLLRMRELHQENTRLRAQQTRARAALAQSYDLCGIVYASPQMHQMVSLAVHVAPSDAPVLVTGPTGSGKEKLAEIVQANSRRKQKPFVKINAGGLPDELLEAELFGAEQGAFTGAHKLRIGRFEAAHGGTLFLDEIGNLSLTGQAQLLRVLQTGEFERLGSSTTRKADVRIISATNIDLQKAIAQGRFREDLYFRLNVIELKLPALAERPDDILPLAEHFLQEFAQGGAPFTLDAGARNALLHHDWPGNVRELHNRVQRATLICTDRVVRTEDFGLTSTPDPVAPAEPASKAREERTPSSADPERADDGRGAAERLGRGLEGRRRAGPEPAGVLSTDGTARDRARTQTADVVRRSSGGSPGLQPGVPQCLHWSPGFSLASARVLQAGARYGPQSTAPGQSAWASSLPTITTSLPCRSARSIGKVSAACTVSSAVARVANLRRQVIATVFGSGSK